MAITKRNMMVVATLLLLAASSLRCSTAQTTHVVGEDSGWTIPPRGPMTYTNWAKNQTFMVGDVLVFNFMPGVHDVVQVTKSNYEGCNTNTPISAYSNSPSMVPLTEEGEHYFICSFRGHCLAGQKITINVIISVNDATSGAPTPSSIDTPRSTTTAPAPATTSTHSPTSSASSRGVLVSIFVTFMSTLFALSSL